MNTLLTEKRFNELFTIEKDDYASDFNVKVTTKFDNREVFIIHLTNGRWKCWLDKGFESSDLKTTLLHSATIYLRAIAEFNKVKESLETS